MHALVKVEDAVAADVLPHAVTCAAVVADAGKVHPVGSPTYAAARLLSACLHHLLQGAETWLLLNRNSNNNLLFAGLVVDDGLDDAEERDVGVRLSVADV